MKPLPFAEIGATLPSMSPIMEHRRMLFEIPEGAHIQIIVGSRAPAAGRDTPPALLDAAPVERPAPRSGRPLLKGGLALMLLAASFIAGDYFASRPRAPELTRAAAALARPAAPAGEQHAFPDRPLPREAAAPSGQVPTEFQKQLQQPPTVIPPPGQAAALPAPGPGPGFSGTGSAPGKNPFGLEN